MKQKKLFYTLLALLFALLLLTVVGCGEDDEVPEVIYHTVSFDTVGGSAVSPQQVEDGKKAVKPEDPTKEGYVFCGWKNGVLDHAFDSHAIRQSMILRAVWLPVENAFLYEKIQGTETVRLTGLRSEVTVDMLMLPSVIKGFSVTEVAEGAFANLSTERIRGITIPDSIKKIGKRAFADCVDIPFVMQGSFREIGEEAFSGCNALSEIDLADGMESLPYRAFFGCASLRAVILPDSVRVISENAFENCGLVYVVLPARLERIEDSAFDGCRLKNVFSKGDGAPVAGIIGSKNEALEQANLYFYSEVDTEIGTWYFDAKGVPQVRSSAQ